MRLNDFSMIGSSDIVNIANEYGTPIYVYDESTVVKKCKEVLGMPNAYGINVRFAMKANSNKSILNIVAEQGLLIDASSLMEVRRANVAGIDYSKIILTTQEVPEGKDREDLEKMIIEGLRYNVCSLRQLYLIADFAVSNSISLSIRVHPGVGSGESASRNTGDNYSCFGIHMSNINEAISFANDKGIKFTQVHVHIGSGADPKAWEENIDRELDILEKYFTDANSISFGGGLKEARLPSEDSANINELGMYAKGQIEAFFERTGRKLNMEVEPGTYIVANSGYIITKVIDKKSTGDEGFDFIVANGGMELNARPVMYGSRHPFYVVSKDGNLLSSDFGDTSTHQAVLVGRCCESGDSQSLDSEGASVPVNIADPEILDYVVIGGAGAYCSSMAPFNYNSHIQSAEVLFKSNGEYVLIRKAQTLEQILANEL